MTASGDYEDHWFLEIDRDTEPPSRVLRACLKYEEYRRTGEERRRLGIFPAVVWVVPDQKRAATLKRHIAGEARLSRDLFTVVSLDDLATVVTAGSDAQETDHDS